MMPDQNGIIISKKQASVTAALLVLLTLLAFVAGYFWGKRSMLNGFTQKTSQESFNDQVDYLLTMQSFAAKHAAVPEEVSSAQEADQSSALETDIAALLQNMPDALEERVTKDVASSTPKGMPTIHVNAGADKVEHSTVVPSPTGKHFAALAGFAKKSFAVAMMDRLKKHKIDTQLVTKVSKAASGKGTKTWYQVVTKKYDSKEDVAGVVDRVVSIEHIKRKDIKIL